MNFNKRTHNCGELNLSAVGETITLNGWVAKKRDLGGILFIDLRDRYGITQLKINPDNKNLYDSGIKLGNEFVISATGKVIKRESINKYLPTGEIEIEVTNFEILNESETPPFNVEEDVKASDDLRLQYRYLDMRRHTLTDNLILRNNVYHIVHEYFKNFGFLEIETPILMKSTPEGARDYLVPSRVHKGKFYALPQSPQTYKQILMVAGLDKYVQICKCFRDEDLRADRQPEFTQIDLEMSFVTQEDIFQISEGFFRQVWKEIMNIDIPTPFRIMTYNDAIQTYGSDKPDLRIKGEMKIHTITESLLNSGFKVFDDVITSKGTIAAIKLEKQEVTRKSIDGITDFVKKLGLGGIAYIKIAKDGAVTSPIQKFLGEEKIKEIISNLQAEPGDTIFILSGDTKKVYPALGNLRLKLAEDFKLIDESKYEFLWIIDFPLFHYEEEENRYVGEHHIFTMPKDEFLRLLDSTSREEIESIRANCYDLVLNGTELGSGSIRIHKPGIQKKVFNIIGLTDEEAKEKFGFLLEAFQYGAPPHGGVAFGFDRLVAILCGLKSIRDVIAFPKSVSASSLMDNCPNIVEDKQLKELGISITKS
jgi:aspartyl-tRNA synthetase